MAFYLPNLPISPNFPMYGIHACMDFLVSFIHHTHVRHTCTHTYKHTHAHNIHTYDTHACMHACSHSCTHAYTHAYTHIHTCMHSHTCIHMYTHRHTHMHARTHTHTHNIIIIFLHFRTRGYYSTDGITINGLYHSTFQSQCQFATSVNY